MDDDAAAAASPSPSPSSSGASPSSPRSKRSRTDRYALGFEFAPRPAPPAAASRGSPEWTEDSTFALLDAWGDRFVRAGRRSLRGDEWLEVSRLVATPAGYFSEAQCRNRIDTLRKMFRKEEVRSHLTAHRPFPSKWVYFDKMLSLMCPPPPLLQPPVVTRRRDTQPIPRLSWGMDAGEYVLAGCGGAAPGDSGSDAESGEEHTEWPGALKRKEFAVLTESIRKLGEVYERMESNKRQHIAEVKQMRRDLQRDLDARWREILDKAEAEIASLGEEDGEEGDVEEEGDDNRRLGDDDVGQEQNDGTVSASH